MIQVNYRLKLQQKCKIFNSKTNEHPQAFLLQTAFSPKICHIHWVILYSFLPAYCTAPVCNMELPINWVSCVEHAECVTLRCDSHAFYSEPHDTVHRDIVQAVFMYMAVACWLDNCSRVIKWANIIRELFMWFLMKCKKAKWSQIIHTHMQCHRSVWV